MSEAKKEPDKTVLVIYAGLRDMAKGTAMLFLTLPEGYDPSKRRPDDLDVDTLKGSYYSDDPGTRKSTSKNLMVGWIYSLPMLGEHTAFFGRIKSVRDWHDADKRAEWTAMDRSLREALEAETFQKREHARRVDLECLAPLRAAYERLSPRERAAMLTRVTRYLMTGR